jgi:transcriptional regulator with XRE-family HTH domain
VSVAIVNGEAIDAAGALSGETERGRGASTRRKTRNDLLRRARLMQRSPSGSGLAMSRQELTEAVNAHVYAASGRTVALDCNHVGKMERGEIRWPSPRYRAALCAVLGADRSADLGFYVTREGVDPDPPEPEPVPDSATVAPSGDAGRRREWCTAPRTPNDLLRQARLALRSPSGSGRVLSRQELAEAVNASVYEQTGRRCFLDGRYISGLERGETRWPSAHYRAGLRAVLGATTDAEIGLFIIHGAGRSPEAAASVPTAAATGVDRRSLAEAAPATAATVHPSASAVSVGEAGAGLAASEVIAGPAAVQVSVSAGAGAAVTVVCQDGAPGRVAVLAGTVRVLIDTSGADAASLFPDVVDTPMVAGGARVYSLAQRRAAR